MTTPSSLEELREKTKEKLLDFQKESIEEWNAPYGKNLDMIELLNTFTNEVSELFRSYMEAVIDTAVAEGYALGKQHEIQNREALESGQDNIDVRSIRQWDEIRSLSAKSYLEGEK